MGVVQKPIGLRSTTGPVYAGLEQTEGIRSYFWTVCACCILGEILPMHLLSFCLIVSKIWLVSSCILSKSNQLASVMGLEQKPIGLRSTPSLVYAGFEQIGTIR